MSKKTALEAKEKGNAAFKAGDFPGAIGHYTAAIIADPEDATFPLNRAAAYLKLGKNDDAERDCTKVLSLDPKNVKGVFRRGQARFNLGKLEAAREDFQQVLKLDPSNSAVEPELARLEDVLSKSKPPARTQPMEVPVAPLAGSSRPAAPKRRRIPITIVDDDSPAPSTKTSSSADLMTPVSSRSLGPSTSPAEVRAGSTASPSPVSAPAPSKPVTFQDAKKARDTARSVGGGIFRPSGQHSIIGTNGSLTGSQPQEPQVKISTPKTATIGSWLPKHEMSSSTKAPMTSIMFIRSWDSLKEPDKQWKLLTQIPPPSIPSLFQTSLETQYLTSIVRALAAALDVAVTDPSSADLRRWVQAYMVNLAKVPRFQTVTLFMSADEKAVTREVLSTLESTGYAVDGWESVYSR